MAAPHLSAASSLPSPHHHPSYDARKVVGGIPGSLANPLVNSSRTGLLNTVHVERELPAFSTNAKADVVTAHRRPTLGSRQMRACHWHRQPSPK
jgi:hypothetical protein